MIALCSAAHDWKLLESSSFDIQEYSCNRCGATKTEWVEHGRVKYIIRHIDGKQKEYSYELR